MKKLWFLAGGVVLVLLVVGLVVWRTIASGVQPGTVIRVDGLGDGASHDVTVELPNTRLVLDITTATSSWPDGADAVGAGPDLKVDDGVSGGGRFIGVSWRELSSDLPLAAVAVAGAAMPTLTLVADGERYPLPSTSSFGSSPRSVYVAVHGDPSQVAVEVSFYGATQTVPSTDSGQPAQGQLAPYDDPSRLPQPAIDATRCSYSPVRLSAGQFDPAPAEGDPHFEIPTPIVQVPYAAGLGWAPAGRSWLVVPITTRFDEGTFVTWPRFGARNEVLYLPRLRRTTVTVDGQGPRTTFDYFQQSRAELMRRGTSGAFYVFDVGSGRHVLHFDQLYADRASRRELAAAPGAPKVVTGRVGCAFHVG